MFAILDIHLLAMNWWFVGGSMVVFVGVILLLTILLMVVAAKFIKRERVTLFINEGKLNLEVESGNTLLNTLTSQGILLPSACGGGGSCGVCRCRILEGGGDILPTELTHISRKEIKEHWRLACQVKVKQDMKLQIPDEVFHIKKWECEVISNRNVATFIKEFVVKLPEGERLDFKPGGYIQIEAPPFKLRSFREMDIDPIFRPEWDRYGLWDLAVESKSTVVRAYSMANHPAEGNIIKLNVRIATPPWDKEKKKWKNVPPGIMSSYIFSRKPGDKVMISGPYGEFFIKETNREMVYIGGGAGMAPLRSHIFHLFRTLKTTRKVSYWYGARSKKEIFYEEDFRAIEREFPNFFFHIALSEPLPEDHWSGLVGFIHQVVYDQYLSKHEAPEEIEYYLCGPPQMLQATLTMLDNLGVPKEMIAFDDFGG